MKWLDLTLPTPAANLALDEALLDACDAGGSEVLRFWEPQEYFVVVGFGNHVATEVHQDVCKNLNVPVLRRCSGGGTVLQGPGCLNYTVILRIESAEELRTVTGTNRFVMERHRQLFQETFGLAAKSQGMTDLTLGEKKFSGNAQRRKRDALVFHGTFLLEFDLAMIGKLLPPPSREPDYRNKRSHQDFVTNLRLPAGTIKEALKRTWSATGELPSAPDFTQLMLDKYCQPEWNFRF